MRNRRAYNRAYYLANNKQADYRRRNRRLVDTLKAGPCSDCGRSFPPECMDFDHVRGAKTNDVSEFTRTTVSTNTILAEIAKCDLVCANCHRVRTFTRRGRVAADRGVLLRL